MIASYWGQNSYGATHSNTALFQQRLSFYCGSDSTIDAFPLAFLNVFFGAGGVPSINLANVCSPLPNHYSVRILLTLVRPATRRTMQHFRGLTYQTVLLLQQIFKRVNQKGKSSPSVSEARLALLVSRLTVRRKPLLTQFGICSWAAQAPPAPLATQFWMGEITFIVCVCWLD